MEVFCHRVLLFQAMCRNYFIINIIKSILPFHVFFLYMENIKKNSFTFVIVSPDESWGYLALSTVTLPPLQRFPFGCDNFKNILVRLFKFGVWVYVGNATNATVL